MYYVKMAATLLMVIGSINWGLVGLLNMDLVTELLGYNMIAKTVYILVGVAGVYGLIDMVSGCCSMGTCSMPSHNAKGGKKK